MNIENNIIWMDRSGYSYKSKNKIDIEASPETKAAYEDIINSNIKKCPYSNLDRGGYITYNGVTFTCDYDHNAICLGNVADEKNTLKISLPSGGTLMVNRENTGDLLKAMKMFSIEDRRAIMEAIQLDNHCKSKENLIEDNEYAIVNDIVCSSTTANIQDLREIMYSYKNMIYDKIMNHDTERKVQIGGSEFTDKQWDKLINTFDRVETQIMEETKERVVKMRLDALKEQEASEEAV